SKKFQQALHEIEKTQSKQVKEIRQEAEAERSKYQEETAKKINELKAEVQSLKQKSPESVSAEEREKIELFQREYPQGGSPEEIQKRVELVIQGKIDLELTHLAYQKLDQWNQEGKIEDITAKEAWETFKDMKNPTHELLNWQDE